MRPGNPGYSPARSGYLWLSRGDILEAIAGSKTATCLRRLRKKACSLGRQEPNTADDPQAWGRMGGRKLSQSAEDHPRWRNQLCVLAGWNRSELCVLARRDRSELCILTSCSGPCILAGRWRPALFSPACFSEPCVVTCRWRTCNAAADEVAPGKGPLEGPSIHGRKRRTGVSEGSVKTDVLALSFLHKKINNAAKEGCRIIQLELYTIVYEWLHVCVQVQYSCCC
ncbi:uncharacterized protein LOC129176994 isoform X4 [Dunckerocampus dactyliophorus]|uniref:uncharacterized protein LOC129176994 isoform X4 n=1 Tax=Dunckerocampus dactyliophorus TaxID=161453 RepID=UPI0024050737|nr:uncharacterized protein LOC129176994 isoform X4 [Dunckerocampus dactyliophorus]